MPQHGKNDCAEASPSSKPAGWITFSSSLWREGLRKIGTLPKAVDVAEFSFFVPGVLIVPGVVNKAVDKSDRLKSVLIDEGKRYNQESFLYRGFAKPWEILYVTCATGVETPIGSNLSFQQIGDCWSRLHQPWRRQQKDHKSGKPKLKFH
jgi:hypothetical protein